MLQVLNTEYEKGTLSDFLKRYTYEELTKIAINIQSDLKTKKDFIVSGIVLFALDNYQELISNNSHYCK